MIQLFHQASFFKGQREDSNLADWEQTSISCENTCFPKVGAILERLPVSMAKKKETKTNKNENKQQNDFTMQICMTSFLATNRLFGKTDKHLTNCLTVPSCLFVCLLVCFVSCEFFLGYFSYFFCWVSVGMLGGSAPACSHSKGLYSRISCLLNIYTR